jgi:anti-sigma regulatory factor (Ser/Thr protein kinase)
LYGKPEDGGKAEVYVSWKCSEDGFVFSVEDHGPGIPAELREEGRDILSFEEHGRGILLMQTILDELTFNEKGNRLTGSVRW